jgi:hypothetical protein
LKKINRFLLKLVNENNVVADKKTAYEKYFSHSPLTKEPNVRYDRDRRCYYFNTMEEAIKAKQHLKEHFERELRSEKISGMMPMYDVMSEMIPWYDCDFDRKTLQSMVENGKGSESALIPIEMQGIENLLEELEQDDLNNPDRGDIDMDIPKSEEAIRLAEIGIGVLKHVINGVHISVSIEEAKEIIKTDPDSIILVMDEPF